MRVCWKNPLVGICFLIVNSSARSCQWRWKYYGRARRWTEHNWPSCCDPTRASLSTPNSEWPSAWSYGDSRSLQRNIVVIYNSGFYRHLVGTMEDYIQLEFNLRLMYWVVNSTDLSIIPWILMDDEMLSGDYHWLHIKRPPQPYAGHRLQCEILTNLTLRIMFTICKHNNT